MAPRLAPDAQLLVPLVPASRTLGGTTGRPRELASMTQRNKGMGGLAPAARQLPGSTKTFLGDAGPFVPSLSPFVAAEPS